jgi:hypothetical protein
MKDLFRTTHVDKINPDKSFCHSEKKWHLNLSDTYKQLNVNTFYFIDI